MPKLRPGTPLLLGILLLAATETSAGEFKAVYSPVSNATYQEWEAELREEKALEGLAAQLNARLRLPVDVTITVAECGTDNAFYSSDRQTITVCCELVH